MSVRGTRKRIEALESALPPRVQPDGLDDETVRAALELLSMEELRALRSLAELDRKCDGTVGREPDAREMLAQRPFARALNCIPDWLQSDMEISGLANDPFAFRLL